MMLRSISFVALRPRTFARYCSSGGKITAPPMVYISGEEMTRYAMELIIEKWVKPRVDISAWEFYDLSCKNRDDTNDQVLHDAVEAGKRIGAIFKEPTITPTEVQRKSMGLKKAWGSPNGAMRRGWNGITISRDTIHIPGVQLGYKRPVLFERHAVGGEYGAGWKPVGRGKLVTQFFPAEGGMEATLTRTDFTVVDERDLNDQENVAVVYHNPLDNVADLAHHFFSRCYEAGVVPYVVTKKTVFKWQEGFWTVMKQVFDEHYKEKFTRAGLLDGSGELQHLISDAATMQIIRWTDGGFGMAAHNYDGDMLTDEVAQVHRSPGFITSNLIGKREDGTLIKEFEASHGTVADLWAAHLRGEETSFNPLGMITAIIGAINHAASLQGGNTMGAMSRSELVKAKKKAVEDEDYDEAKRLKEELVKLDAQASACKVTQFTAMLEKAVHTCFRVGEGTRDMVGPNGLTTEEFIDKVEVRLSRYLRGEEDPVEPDAVIVPERRDDPHYAVDSSAVKNMFDQYDLNGDGTIDAEEFEAMLVKLGVAPLLNVKAREQAAGEREAGQV
eukprot:Sspe_Gene.5055::Locus_1660_Transcript_1_1_Confidence_1.000_Length_1771::g.5055::m.5055